MSRHETPINKQRKVVAELEGENTESKLEEKVVAKRGKEDCTFTWEELVIFQ